MTRDEYHWFLDHGARACARTASWATTTTSPTSTWCIDDGGQCRPSGEIFGYYVITKQYFDRYHLPVMHTETNRKDADDAPAWLWKEWSNVVRLQAGRRADPRLHLVQPASTRPTGTPPCARTTTASTRWACTISTARSARSARPTS